MEVSSFCAGKGDDPQAETILDATTVEDEIDLQDAIDSMNTSTDILVSEEANSLDWQDFLSSDLIQVMQGLDNDENIQYQALNTVSACDLANIEPLAVTMQGNASTDGVTSRAKKREAPRKMLRGPSRNEVKKQGRKLPKRPISAYNLFFQRERYTAFEEERSIVGPSLGPEMLGKIMGRRWKNMSAEKREKYQTLSKIDALRYRKEMAEYELIHGQRKYHNGTEIDQPKAKRSRETDHKKCTRRLTGENAHSHSFPNEHTPAFPEFPCPEPECVDMTQIVRMVSQEESTLLSVAPRTHCIGGESQYSSESRSPNLSRQSSAHEREPSSPYAQHQTYSTDFDSRQKHHSTRSVPYSVCYPPCVPTYEAISPPPAVSSMPHQSHLASLPVGGFPPPPFYSMSLPSSSSYSMSPPLPSWDCPDRIPVRNGMCVQLPDPQTGVERFYNVQYKCYQMTRAEANAYMAACCGDDGGSSAQESPNYRSPPTMELEQLLRTPLPPGCKEIKFPLY